MPRLIWSSRALRDVERLHRFLAGKNSSAARHAVSTIRQGVKLLERHPEAGRPIKEMASEFREWPVPFGRGGYLVLYRHDRDQVVILAVRHGREMDY